MHKNNQKLKNKLELFLNLFLLILFSFIRPNIVYGASNNWIEVSKTNSGIEYIDRDSLKYKDNGVIEVAAKYLKIDSTTSKELEENTYIMRINCLNNKFKDISVNGKENLTSKWEGANGDKLIKDVISDSCKNVETH